MILPLLNRLFSGKISMVALSAGVAAYERGDRPTARRLFAIASSAAPSDATLHERAAAVASGAGDHRMTLDLLASLLRSQPENSDLLLRAALSEYSLGDAEGAARRCEEAIARSGDRDPSVLLGLLVGLRMPGSTRPELLAAIHNWLRPQTYVEIGVAEGQSLLLATSGTRAIGVDPEPAVTRPLPPNTTIYAEKSDDFFANRDVRGLLAGLPIALAFIDGMHLFEYALRDFMNLQRFMSGNAIVVFDDVLPYNPAIASRDPLPGDWTGDVWKIYPILMRYDLDVTLVDVSPTGVLVVSNFNDVKIDYHEMLAMYVAEDTVPLWAIDRSLAVDPNVFLEKMRS